MDLQLKDKVALVAGSSRGIGRAIASGFLDEGARVLISGRDAKSVGTTVEDLTRHHDADRLMSFVGDLTAEAVIRDCVRQVEENWGTPDVVVANIGSGKSVGGWQIGGAEYLRALQFNFLGSVGLIETSLPGLIEKKSGSIVLISSIAGVEAIAAPLPYASAKSALLAYGKNLSRLIAPHGVRVNIVAPGNILFPGGSWEVRQKLDPDQVERYIQAEVPLQRFGTPEEVAAFVVFLCSAKASFATGMCAVLDGGQTRTI